MTWLRADKLWPLLCLLAVEARALEPFDVGIFFDAQATSTSTTIEPMVPFDVFVVTGPVMFGGLDAYEFLVDADPRVTFVSETTFPEATSRNFATHPGPSQRNYLVATGFVCIAEHTQEVLVHLSALVASAAEDVLFCLEGAIPSSFVPERPGFWSCGAFEPDRLYSLAYRGCAVANPVTVQPPVGVRELHWGALKASY